MDILATLALQSHSHEQLLVARLHTQEVKCFELKSVFKFNDSEMH